MEAKVQGVDEHCYLSPVSYAKIKKRLEKYALNKDYFLCHKNKDVYVPVKDGKLVKVLISSNALDLLHELDIVKSGDYNTQLLLDAVQKEFDMLDGKIPIDDDFIVLQAERLTRYMVEINLLDHPDILLAINKFIGSPIDERFRQLVYTDQLLMKIISEMYPETSYLFRPELI